jgi:O-antigen/teichoic acid export membrane protein
VKSVARNRESFSEMWGRALITTTCCGGILIGVVLLLAHLVLPSAIPFRLVLSVAISDLLGLNLITITSQAFQAFEQMHWMATISVSLSASRLLGVLLLVAVVQHPSALQWGYIYACTTAVVVFLSSCLVFAKLGKPQFMLRPSLADLREGSYFSIGLSAQSIYNDTDKTMLAHFGTLEATGIYGAAYRLVDVTVAPVQAMLYAAYPNFFRKGGAGISSGFAYARPLLMRAMGYGALVCIAILLLADTVPYILGGEYVRVTEALRWLSPLPFLKATHYFLSDTLTGSGHQRLRSIIQMGVALFNVLINLWLIPAYSWRGAAWSSIASDMLLACSVGTAVYALAKRSQPFVTSRS